MDDFFVIFNDKTNLDIGVDVAKRPDIPSPMERVLVKERDGGEDLHKHTGIFEDMVISVEFNYHSPHRFNDVWRMFKKWLIRYKDNKLRFSDDLNHFYKVCQVKISDNARQELWEFGNTTVEFTVKPYCYLMEGLNSVSITNSFTYYNEYEECFPTYLIKGEGNLTFNINGKELKINVGQEVEINTELENCFKTGNLINLPITNGDIKDMRLKEGNNTFSYSVTSGSITSIIMIPNLREL